MKKDKEVRERILELSQEQFLRSGFRKVTMDELANKLGMSKKTVYAYFPSKERLLREVVERMMRTTGEKIDQIVQSPGRDFGEKLKRLLTFMGMQMSRIGPGFVQDIQRSAPELFQKIDQFRREKILANLGKLFKEGVKKGIFREDINQELFVLMYANTVQTTLNPEVLAQLPVSLTDIFNTIIKVFFEGILTEKAKRKYDLGEVISRKRGKS